MSSESVPKLRVVKCPKCKVLLPEPPGYDLYKCGECGTTLLAKKRSVSLNSKTDSASRNALDLVSESKQGSDRKHLVPTREDSLKAKVTASFSSGEFHLDGNDGRGQSENGECNGNQLVPFILSDEGQETELDMYKLSHRRRHRVANKGSSTSNKVTHSEIEEINDGNLLEESKEESDYASDEEGNNDESALIGGKYEKEITGGDLEGTEELNNKNLLPEGAKEELISESDGDYANKDKSAPACANPEVGVSESDSEGTEDLNNANLIIEGAEEELSSALNGENANDDKSAPNGDDLEVEITGTNRAQELNNGKLLPKGAEHDEPGGEDSKSEQSTIEGAKPEVNTTESASTTKRSSSENDSILHVTETASANPVPVSSNKQPKQAQKNIHHGFDRARSVDTSELIDPSSELSRVLGKLSKSPTTRSSCAYDGSLSSYDGMDDQFPIHHSDSFDNTHTIANGVSEGRTKKGKGLVNSLVNRDLENTQNQSHLPNANHHVMKDSRRTQNKVLETTRHGHRRLMRAKRDEFPPKMPFHRSSSHSLYERGSSSNQMHDELYCSSSFLSPNSFENPDQEKMKLLRMIHRLQDQLNRTRYMSGDTNGRLSKGVSYKGNHISSSYHNLDLLEGRRISHGLQYTTCNGRCNHGVNWHQRRNKYSHVPSSAEATSHVNHSCYHCFQERHFSADMPPHVPFQHEELLHRSYPGQDYCSFSHHSYPSSPQWSTPSKLPPMYGNSNAQRHRALHVRKYLREKKNLAKRLHKPVAGGAPFVTCHKCLKLLQLPADFLLFKRSCHQLKCGECSQVLKFSVHGNNIVYVSPNKDVVPPSSELNDQSEVISSRNLPSTAHANYYLYSPAEPISYYDDYGLSVSKSYSSEGEPISMTQSHTLHGSEYDRRSVSHGSFEPLKEREKIGPRYSSSTRKTDESAMFSTSLSGSRKLSSEKEARPLQKTSLHQLMGYSSPSQVIRGTRPSVEGKGLILT